MKGRSWPRGARFHAAFTGGSRLLRSLSVSNGNAKEYPDYEKQQRFQERLNGPFRLFSLQLVAIGLVTLRIVALGFFAREFVTVGLVPLRVFRLKLVAFRIFALGFKPLPIGREWRRRLTRGTRVAIVKQWRPFVEQPVCLVVVRTRTLTDT